jgi:DHA2 family methylenomycin A resistance protein-like MFS transporter
VTSGPITDHFGPRVPVVVGQLCMVAGLAAVLATGGLISPLITAACLVPIGASGSMAMPSVTGVVLAGVPQELGSTASAVLNAFRQVGGAVAIEVFAR